MLKIVVSGEEVKSKVMNIALAGLRIFAGLSIAFGHGMGKVPPSDGFIGSVGKMGIPFATFFAWSAGASELFGGILLALGLFTRPSAFFLAMTMCVAAFIRHGDDPFSGKEKALLFLMVFILYLLVGSGKYGLDNYLRKKLN